jgi:hypothetical protein
MGGEANAVSFNNCTWKQRVEVPTRRVSGWSFRIWIKEVWRWAAGGELADRFRDLRNEYFPVLPQTSL